jgi:hypothetical protein
VTIDPANIPIARELFAQWRKARGERAEPATRPFSRDWEQLMEDAALLSATDRNEAERDIRDLHSAGWLEARPVRYRPHLLDRIVIPIAAETRWRHAFGFAPPSDEEARRIRDFPWCAEMAFLRDTRVSLRFEDLRRLHDFFVGGGSARRLVPIKERSLQIFGDEKRLDLVAATILFREDRLTLDHLRCFVVAEPLGWRRGPQSAGPVLVLENAATWDSFCRWNDRVGWFSAVVYGGGNRFAESVGFLAEIFREIGGVRSVRYFGDLDPAGLRIPQRASVRALRAGLPGAAAYHACYRWLLRTAGDRSVCADTEETAQRDECDWLGENADGAWAVLSRGHRVAQEHLNAEVLADCDPGTFSLEDPVFSR